MAGSGSLPRFEVVGRRCVAGVAPGGTVVLDPERVNVAALVEAGHVRPVKPKTQRREESR